MSRKKVTWIDEVTANSLICRDLHHSWKPSTIKRTKEGFERELVCTTCTTVKVQKLTVSGYIIKSRMVYPEDYLRPKGLGRITAAENAQLRLANLRSQL